MLILGVETSCDETSVALVEDGQTILSNVVASSLKEHSSFGGVIPEIASRRQLEFIDGVTREALRQATKRLDDIDAVAYTQKPGLLGSLLVGTAFARSLSQQLNCSLIPVHHVHAHLYASFLSFKEGTGPKSVFSTSAKPDLPAIGLVVSGGHSSFYHMRTHGDYQLIGQTRDDAVGEAFDKVARVLGLGYPGGPVIDRLAKSVSEPPPWTYPTADLDGSLDFSFSGTKTAVLYHTRRKPEIVKEAQAQVAAAFQDSVVGVIVKKCLRACQQQQCQRLIIGGGVAANSGLRDTLKNVCATENIELFIPPMVLCLDNAAMIAGLAFHS